MKSPKLNFDPFDLEQDLQQNKNSRHGSHDMRRWSVTTGDDATDRMSRIISMHELFHHDLNNTTLYGIVLQFYSYISQEKAKDGHFKNEKLTLLVERCRLAHEVYATGLSMMVLMNSVNDTTPDRFLKDNQLYYRFYKTAEALVQGVDLMFHRRLALMVVIRTCFQSSAFAESIRSDFFTFDPDLLPLSAYPNERIKLLATLMPGNFWQKTLHDFKVRYSGLPEIDELQRKFAAAQEQGRGFFEDTDKYGSMLIEWIYEACAELFNKAGISCIGVNEHLDISKEIHKQIDHVYPFDKSQSPLMINSDPFNYDRMLLQNYEYEKWTFRDEPLFCMVIFPEEVTKDFHQIIINGVGTPKHILVMRREGNRLIDQYKFKEEIDYQRLAALKDAVTFLRITTYENGTPIVIIVPFESPEDAVLFLSNKPESVSLLGCVALRTLFDISWENIWRPFFDSFDHTCLLMDTAPLYCIEHIFESYEYVNYEKMVVSLNNQKFTGLIFELVESGETKAILIAPCTEMHCEVMHDYLQRHYSSKYRLILDLEQELKNSIATMLSRICREEKDFFFAAGSVKKSGDSN